MKTTKTYISGCTWCNATGFVNIPNPGFMSSALTGICPVCGGSKIIMIAEVMETDKQYKTTRRKKSKSMD